MKKCVTHSACDCITAKVKNLEKENQKLKEKIQKVIDLKDETINIEGIKQLLRDQ